MRTRTSIFVLSPVLVLLGSAVDSGAAEDGATSQFSRVRDPSFDVVFNDCHDQASIAPVSVASVRPLVPSHYQLTDEATGTTKLVVRITTCTDIVVTGIDVGAGTVAQVGANLVSPDGTGNINNYSFYYASTSLLLAAHLNAIGFGAEFVPGIRFDISPDTGGNGTISIRVPQLPSPYEVGGPVVFPAAPLVAYTANWYSDFGGKTVQMHTPIPGISFGSGTMTLRTFPFDPLGRILGAGTVGFPDFDSFNYAPVTPVHVGFVTL
jgi:hypothetical protein